MRNSLIPMVIDNNSSHERAFDIYSLLLKERIIFLNGPINQEASSIIIAQLLYLNSCNPDQPIHLYIQSPGGEVYAGMGIHDAMQMLSAPIHTYAVGMTGSMGTFLLSAGEPGKRFALTHATIHMHPTGGGSRGYTEDVRIATQEQERLQAQIFHLMGKYTNHDWQEIENYFLRDKYLNAHEAKTFGLIDEVMGNVNDIVFLKLRNIVNAKRVGVSFS